VYIWFQFWPSKIDFRGVELILAGLDCKVELILLEVRVCSFWLLQLTVTLNLLLIPL